MATRTKCTHRRYNFIRDRVLRVLAEEPKTSAFLASQFTHKQFFVVTEALKRMERNGDIETHGAMGNVRVYRLKEKKS